MKRIIGISILLVTVTLMTFAGGLEKNQRGVMAGDVHEIAGLEMEYQFFSMLNYIGFTQDQLKQIIAAAEKAKDSIVFIESEVKTYLEKAVDLVKTGDVEKAREKHEEAMGSGKEIVEIRQIYLDTLKSIITVDQQEKFMDYLSSTVSKRVDRVKENVLDSRRFKQLPEAAKEKIQQMGQFVGNSREQRNDQGNKPMNNQPNVRNVVNQNIYARFFNMLLIDDNLDMMKEYLESVALQNPAE